MLQKIRKAGMLIGAAVVFLSSVIALAGSATLRDGASGASESRGQRIYETHCVACHGPAGHGDGEASIFLLPRPSDFTAGRFKLRSTTAGSPPTDADLLKTVTRGIPSSAMPSFAFLREEERRAVVQYVKMLSGKFPSIPARSRSQVGADPALPRSAAAIAAGQAVYDRLQCATCHGEDGKGDGPEANFLGDAFNMAIKPRNFVSEPFKGGHTVRDIYLRIMTGIEGTPMSADGGGHITTQERWQLAYYVQSLCKARACGTESSDRVLVSKRLKGGLPSTDPLAAAWAKAPPLRTALHPLWNHGVAAPELSIRSLNDGSTIAFLLEWTDVTRDTDFVRPQDFRDTIAMQFASRGGYAPIAMGSRDTEVTIWQWKADWQEQIDRGRRVSVMDIHPWRIEEPYPFPAATAFEAGNQAALEKRGAPAEEATTRRFGTWASLPASAQQVMGRGIWRDGRWHVVLSRQRTHADSKLVLESGVHIAFAVWNGSARDRNGQKAISSWYSLALESR
jgi:mono/diheme cytochrome c family protein